MRKEIMFMMVKDKLNKFGDVEQMSSMQLFKTKEEAIDEAKMIFNLCDQDLKRTGSGVSKCEVEFNDEKEIIDIRELKVVYDFNGYKYLRFKDESNEVHILLEKCGNTLNYILDNDYRGSSEALHDDIASVIETLEEAEKLSNKLEIFEDYEFESED